MTTTNITITVINSSVRHLSHPFHPPNLHCTAPPTPHECGRVKSTCCTVCFLLKIVPWINISIPVIRPGRRLVGRRSCLSMPSEACPYSNADMQRKQGSWTCVSTLNKRWDLCAVNEYIFYYSHDISTRFLVMLIIYLVVEITINHL